MKLKSEEMSGWATVPITACRGAFAGETLLNPNRTWAAVEGRIRRYFGAGRLLRIARPDGGSKYTLPGSYQVTFRIDGDQEWTFGVKIVGMGA